MKPKTIVTAALLLFVAAAVVAAVVRGLRPESPPEETAGGGKAERLVDDGVIAFYLHGNERCVTCKSIQTCADEAVHGGFAEQLEDGRLQWLVFNYDEPEHAHFKKDYGIATPMVVLARRAGGKDVESVTLDEIWPLVVRGDTRGCVEYIRKELEEFLAGPISNHARE